MKLQQLRYICEITKHNLNVSQTAQSLFTTQPGISKHIRMLEDELGVKIFMRTGKNLTHITPAGKKIIAIAEEILQQTNNINLTAQEYANDSKGELSIATTHTQARYVLPQVIQTFREKYPQVSLQMQQGTPPQIANLAANSQVDFAIATEAMEHFYDLIMMPCFHWNRSIVVPKNHPLAQTNKLQLNDVAAYPIVTYTFGFTGRSKLDKSFSEAGLSPNVVLTAVDTDVIKTYVRLGLGVGIIASMAYEKDLDSDLVCLDASHLFAHSTTNIGIRRGAVLRGYMYDFIEMFSPNLNKDLVQQAMLTQNSAELNVLFDGADLPIR